MSEKITFQELIESIADQTNKPKQFTHDFLKDFVAVINSGLENDGTVSIAGFGKFKLRSMDERQGYNPQTGESITIPSHNKVVFKPYKALRELANAPYKHLEAELLEDEAARGSSRDTNVKGVSTSTPPSPSGSQISEQPVEEGQETQGRAPWETYDTEPEKVNSSDTPSDDPEQEAELDNSDIVEYSPDLMKKDYEKKPADSSYSYQEYMQHKKRLRKRIWLATAACLVLLLSAGAGAWYFNSGADQASFDLKTINFFKTAADTQQAPSSAAGKANTSTSATGMQAESNEPAPSSDTGGKSLKPASTKQVIARGQTLWSLANQQYDNPYLWPWIYDENKSAIENPDLIQTGQTLALPLPRGYRGGLSTDDSLQVAIGYIETYQWYKEQGYSRAKYYLYAARMYNGSVFEYTDISIDDSDMAFANRAR